MCSVEGKSVVMEREGDSSGTTAKAGFMEGNRILLWKEGERSHIPEDFQWDSDWIHLIFVDSPGHC